MKAKEVIYIIAGLFLLALIVTSIAGLCEEEILVEDCTALESRLKALEERVDDNNDNLLYFAKVMAKYVNIVHFEGKKE